MPLRITVLVENEVSVPGLMAEHGFSALIERDGRCVLFDTGQGPALVQNAEMLGVDWARIEAIALSHGHYDHTGGLAYALHRAPQARVYAHPQALAPHYSWRAGGPVRAIGIPDASRRALEAHALGVIWTSGPTEIIPGVWISGTIPRTTDDVPTDKGLFSDAACTIPDSIPDDQAIWAETPEGPVVVLGCAHSGVGHTLAHVARETGSRIIPALVGGQHLAHSDEQKIRRTIALYDVYGVRQIAPTHCTGPLAVSLMAAMLPDRLVRGHGGDGLTWG